MYTCEHRPVWRSGKNMPRRLASLVKIMPIWVGHRSPAKRICRTLDACLTRREDKYRNPQCR